MKVKIGRRTERKLSVRRRRIVLAVAAAGVVASLAFVAAGGAAASSYPSWTVKLKSGATFTLAPSIQAKIKAHQPINYVLSYGSCAIVGYSVQYKEGYEASLPVANKIYPIHGTSLCPSNPAGDAPTQIAQIDALLNAGKIDCLSIQPLTSTDMESTVQAALDKGIPTFTVGEATFGNELVNFTQIAQEEGETAGKAVITFMKAHHLHFKTFAVSSGLPSVYWAIHREDGFIDAIKAAIPNATFVTTASNSLNTTYVPGTTYDDYKAFLTGVGKNVQVIENTDIGAGIAARVITALGRAGKVFSVGWNDTPDQIAAVKAGTEIAFFDQNWPQQAAYGAVACSTFMKTGKLFPNIQKETPITKANLSVALARLADINKYALTGLTSGLPSS